jgi:hypothetical protein
MNSEQPVSLEKWRLILAFSAGSVATVVVSMFGPPTWRQIGALVVALVFWAIQGLSTGAWIILSRQWKQVDRSVRFRFGWSFLAIGWGAFVAMTITTPIGGVIVVTTLIALAIILTAQAVENRQRKSDEGEIFP